MSPRPLLLPAFGLLALLALARCGPSEAIVGPGSGPGGGDAGEVGGSPDAGSWPADAGQSGDAGGRDAGTSDAGASDAGELPDAGQEQDAGWDPTDEDEDTIPDALEDWLAERLAPEVHLAPDSEDWTRPSSVDWYLSRVHMRFDHPQCPDHEVVALGSVTQENLSQQSHATSKSLFSGCGHTDTVLTSDVRHLEFFLQPPDDAVHAGSPPEDWRVYVHVKRSQTLPGGYDVQYWYFFPYNDFVASVNHEGDWEHVTVVADAEGQVDRVHYAQHNGGEAYLPQELSFSDTHVVVYIADGSHASYPSVGEWDVVAGTKDRTYAGGPVWRTWESWVNVGERDAPRNGQHFIRFGGRWGEIGTTDVTSGPPTPSVQDAWDAL